MGNLTHVLKLSTLFYHRYFVSNKKTKSHENKINHLKHHRYSNDYVF